MQPLHTRVAGLTLTALLVTACGTAADNMAADSASTAAAATNDVATVRAAIEANNAAWAAAIIASDVPTAAGMYAADGVMMQPGMPAASGKAAIEESMKGMMAAMKVDSAVFTTKDVMVDGNTAIETGAYRMTMTPMGGKPMSDAGKYLTVWQKQADGSWKVVRDINNTDVAPPSK